VSESIAHTAVLDDGFRLVGASDCICSDLKQVAASHHDFARLGSVTRSGDRFTVQLLGRFRSRWEGRDAEDRLEPKLAYVLGWLSHRAADRQMKPVFRALDPDCPRSPTDCSVYHDAFLFREVYASGKQTPFGQATVQSDLSSLSADAGFDVPAAEALLRDLLQRALIGIHTFIPDAGDVEGWLDRLFALQQGFQVDVRRYAEAIKNPDPDRVRRFITEGDFYGPEEPIISAARRLQRGENVPSSQVEDAYSAHPVSHYARALKLAFGYLRAASAFWTGDIALGDLPERFDIGQPGRDGMSV